MKTDIEIAQEAKMEHISKIAARAGLREEDIEYYGKYKAKIDLSVMQRDREDESSFSSPPSRPRPRARARRRPRSALQTA